MNSGFKDALNKSGMTMYSLAKQTDVPYTTINRLMNERLSINNCNAGAVFKIASIEPFISAVLERMDSA